MKLFAFSIVIILISGLLGGCNSNSGQRIVGIDPDQPSNDSLMEGERSVFSENGKLHYIVEYKKGKANGRVREFYTDGKLYMDAIYKDGHRNGKCTHFFKNGKPFGVANFINGQKDGIETKYYEDGKILATIPYKKDKVQPGLKEFKKDGTEIREDISLLIKEIDHSAIEGKYYVQVSLSHPHADVKFYASPQSDPDSREKLKMSGSTGILNVPLSNGGFVMKKLIFDAEYKTSRGNTMRLQKFYNLAVDL